VPIWPDLQSKHMLGRFRSNFKKMCWRVDLKRASRPFDCCELDLMGHWWPTVIAIWKFTFQSDSYVNIRIALIYNTFLVIARANRPNKQREAKSSTHLTFSWHTSKLSSLILWNARVTDSQSCSCLKRVRPVDDPWSLIFSNQTTFWCLL
jgi:hypothetical protein